jgi:hypothetical protein
MSQNKGAIDRILNALGHDPEDQMVRSTKVWAAQDFFFWRAISRLLPYEEALDEFRELWRKNAAHAWPAVLEALGTEEIKDMKTLARAFIKFHELFGIPVRIVEERDDQIVFDNHFCANPAYTPEGYPHEEKMNFYKAVAEISRNGFVHVFPQLAKIENTFEMDQIQFRCMGDDVCRYVIRRRNFEHAQER